MGQLAIVLFVLFVLGAAAAVTKRRARKLPAVVLLVGDSLAQGLGPPLTRQLAGRGVALQSVAVQGSSARTWRSQFLTRAFAASDARLVLVSLGTNDSVSHELAAEFPGNAVRLAERLAAAKRDVVWLMPPKAGQSVRWTLEQPQFDTLEPPAGLLLDKTGHPQGDGYERWAASIVAAFPTE